MEVNRREVERYLGYRGLSVIDDKMKSIIEECITDMTDAVTPRETHKTFPIVWDASGEGCSFSDIRVNGGNLVRNLKGCHEIVMMAVTIGPGADRLVRRAELRDMLKAYTYQAVGAAAVEAWCDEVNEMIRKEADERGLFTRPRFSPGYGDFPLEVQKDFERILEMPRSIGVSLSESLLMTPTKSITAVIGLSDKSTECHRAGCEECNMHETCEYSRA
ncbi:MAG: Vitamin B12 dependent methionine synthase activation subunit [Eubacterium sp.]|nr:Vitamin B12 dependent methionine synthase activation subunit [Eubacterium sp.]